MKKTDQTGFSIVEILLIVVVVCILGFIGWYMYHSKNITNKTYSTSAAQSQATSTQYVSIGSKGTVLATKADVANLTGAGSALKQYFDANIGLPVQDPTTVGADSAMTVPQTFTVYGVYGDYASIEVNSDDFGSLVGPQASGAIGVLVTDQGDLSSCSMLAAAHVPAVLVGSKCVNQNGNATVYKG